MRAPLDHLQVLQRAVQSVLFTVFSDIISHFVLELVGNHVLRDIQMSDEGLLEAFAEEVPHFVADFVVLTDVQAPNLFLLEQLDETANLSIANRRRKVLNVKPLTNVIRPKRLDDFIHRRGVDVGENVVLDLQNDRAGMIFADLVTEVLKIASLKDR